MSSRFLAHFIPEGGGVETANAQPATGTGTAYDATVVIFGNGRAELASGTGTAHNPRILISSRAEAASGSGTAPDALGTTIPAVTRTGGTFSIFASATTSPQTVAFTLPAATNYLVAMVSTFSSVTITSMTWKPDSGNAGADQAMSLIATSGTSFTGAGTTHIWGLANPTATVTGSLIEHSLSSATKRIMGVHALSNVVSVGPPVTAAPSDDFSINVVSTYKALVLDVVRGSNSTGTYTAAQTERWDIDTTGGVNNLRGAGSEKVGNHTVNMAWVTPATTLSVLGISFNPTAQAGVATGTGTAYDATVGGVATTVSAGLASGTGDAKAPRPHIKPNAERATGTGSATGPSAATTRVAGLATGTGAALDAYAKVLVNAETMAGTGQAYDATVSASAAAPAGTATGTGSALAPSVHVQVNTDAAIGTGSAYDATVSLDTAVQAEVAIGTGSANNASIHVAPRAGLATGTGTAHTPAFATIITGSFGLDAEIIIPPGTHDRRALHFGTQEDTTITTHEVLGPLPVGTTLDVVLAYLYGNVPDANMPRFGLDAVIFEAGVAAFGLDAWIGLAGSGSFGLTSIIERSQPGALGLDAVIHAPTEPWNLVRTPIGGEATYTAISERTVPPYANPGAYADDAANGIRVHDFFGDAWQTTAAGAIGDWWQVTWNIPQTVDRVVIYDGSIQTDGSPSTTSRFGNTGNVTFSDGSSVPYSGLNDTVLTLDFAPRNVTWFRITSTTAGGSFCSLSEVEAYNTEQWED